MYNISEEEYRYLQKIIDIESFKYPRCYKDEFISVGNYAIGKACKLFKENNGVKFTTYASKSIKNEFINYVNGNNKRLNDLSMDNMGEDKNGNIMNLYDMIPSKLTDYNKEVNNIILQLGLKSLNERERIAILMDLEGYKQREIGEIINMKQNHITAYLRRCYKKLEKIVNK